MRRSTCCSIVVHRGCQRFFLALRVPVPVKLRESVSGAQGSTSASLCMLSFTVFSAAISLYNRL